MAAKLLEPIPPGEILSEDFMKPLGLSINALARDIDVPPNRISEILSGKRAVTVETALRLGKYFGVSPEIWVGLQADYDIRVAKQTTWPKIEPRVRARAARERLRSPVTPHFSPLTGRVRPVTCHLSLVPCVPLPLAPASLT